MEGNKTDALPGFEHPMKVPELSEAAIALKKIRSERMEFTKQEKEAADKVLALMREHDFVLYIDDDFDPPLKVELVSTEKVKIAMKDGEVGEDE